MSPKQGHSFTHSFGADASSPLPVGTQIPVSAHPAAGIIHQQRWISTPQRVFLPFGTRIRDDNGHPVRLHNKYRCCAHCSPAHVLLVSRGRVLNIPYSCGDIEMITRPIESGMPMTHLQVVSVKSLSARGGTVDYNQVNLSYSFFLGSEAAWCTQNLNNQVFIFPPFKTIKTLFRNFFRDAKRL